MFKVSEGFTEANTSNLPHISVEMVTNFIAENNQNIESTGTKQLRSSRQSYGDAAIGYVEIKVEANFTTVRAKMTPEDRVHNKSYPVEVVVDNNNDTIISCQCTGCIAFRGGCKHAIAFLFWLHRRSEEPSTTEVICYWKKSELSKVGGKNFKSLEEICGHKHKSNNLDLLPEIKKLKKHEGDFKLPNVMLQPDYVFKTYIQSLTVACQKEHTVWKADTFLQFCSLQLKDNITKQVEQNTRGQSKKTLWYQLRFGRITASFIYEASRCTTADGYLISKIFGTNKSFQSLAMKRGLELEPQIIKILKKQLSISIKPSGLILNKEYPILGASPDGVTNDSVLEIKSPRKTVDNYIKNGKILNKYFAQIQLQMKLTNMKKGIFVVADPNFENNKNLHIVNVSYNEDYCNNLIVKATKFWKDFVFPKLTVL